ncbi:hypothetical protein HNY73_016666 [Argiope bruennichi]|uniref:Uncharacterized protein n=1 Tax=Argiope bruennichi TaxID=94029 RepID=A0A8T0EJH0_ARGBR|nr:hypothetical protein HNY73_016666 [Argiope bruennichi]
MFKTTIQKITSENLSRWKIFAKLVPKVLRDEQKHWRVHASSEMLKQLGNGSDLLKDVRVGDESWVFRISNAKIRSGIPRYPRYPRKQEQCQFSFLTSVEGSTENLHLQKNRPTACCMKKSLRVCSRQTTVNGWRLPIAGSIITTMVPPIPPSL